MVTESGFVSVAEAARALRVTEVTIRSDLGALERAGMVRRVRGGAVVRQVRETPVEATSRRDAAVKRAIGEHAAASIASGTSVLLDVGSTVLAVARGIVARQDLADVVVVTNGLGTALELEPAIPRITVVLTGGTLRPLQHSLVNPLASQVLADLHVDLAILGCNGVDESGRVSNLNLPEAEVKRSMLQVASRRMLVADASKFGQSHLGAIGDLTDFDTVVTGGSGAGRLAALAREHGCDAVIAGV